MKMITPRVTVCLAMASAAFATSVGAAPVLEPTTQGFIDALAAQSGPPIYTLAPGDARNLLAEVQSRPTAKLPARIENRTLPVGPTGSVKVRIVKPEHAGGPLPVVMYFHGGGWVLGDADTHDRLIREIANGAHVAVVFVEYDRSPEAKYPVPVEQAYAATEYVAKHGRELGVDPSRMAVAGDSVGGNMTAAVTLLAKQRHGPALRYQVLFYPVTDADFDDGSYQEFANGP